MKVFNFHMPIPLRERLLAERDRTGLSEAEIIRRALDEHLDAKEGRASGHRTVNKRVERAGAV